MLNQHLTNPDQYLIQIWVGVLGIGFELGGGKFPFVFLHKCSYWSKFYVNINIIIGSGVMTISFYKGLTRNQKYPCLSFAQCLETGAIKEY